ncbi:hypothetical protein V2H77_06710 [Photorhabdus sp. P32]|uniref:hypothetical protein n=1 Tax=Photorhabdus sp. P32 TaxID=3117549 RepID=UPI00311AFB21
MSERGDINIRFDPLLDRAISLGIAEGILELDTAKSITLTNKGDLFSKKIYKDDTMFILEKSFVENFNKLEFSDKKIDHLLYKGII